MTLLGQGVLAFWNGMAEGTDADFIEWHVREHIPERVGVPGFLRGRRYVAEDGHPKYFNFYETETPAALTSSAYMARLNDPSPWTRRVIAEFRETSRTICKVAASLGVGTGAWMETLRLRPAPDGEPFRSAMTGLLPDLLATWGIMGVHLLEGMPNESGGATAEKALRGVPDQTVDWVLLVEGIDAEPLLGLRQGALAADELARRGVAPGADRGLYRFQYGLTKAELDGR
jgi:hypothetical protein